MIDLHRSVHGIGASALGCARALKQFLPEERANLGAWYLDLFKQDISHGIRRLTPDDVALQVLSAFTVSPNAYRVAKLRKLLEDVDPDQQGLFLTLLSITPAQHQSFMDAYEKETGTRLAAVLAASFSDKNWCRLLKAYFGASPTGVVDPVHGADQLKAAVGLASLNEEVFVRFAATLTAANYREISVQYERKYSEPLEEVILREFSPEDRWPFLFIHYAKLDLATAIAFALASNLHLISPSELDLASGSDGHEQEEEQAVSRVIDMTALFAHDFADSVARVYSQFGVANLDWARFKGEGARSILMEMWNVAGVL